MGEMMEFEKMSENDIINLAQKRENAAMEYLLEKYKPLVRQKTRKLFLIDGDKDDLIQEGMIGLYKAVRDYKEDSAAKFSTFAYTCIKRQILTAVTKDNNKKNMPLNMSLPTEKDKDDNDISDEGLLSDNGVSNPEFLILKKEDNLEKRNKLMTVLSPFEQSVCEMMFMEYDYRQIAAKLNKEEKVIDNAMQRIKLKAKKIFKD